MIRSSFLRRTLLLVMSTILVFALLIAGIYSLVSPQIFAAEKIADMLPQGRLIAVSVRPAALFAARRAHRHQHRPMGRHRLGR